MCDQYDKLRKRNAFLEQYKKEALGSDALEEFDSSREVVQNLIAEYQACETPDYVNWGVEKQEAPSRYESAFEPTARVG